MKTPVDTTTSAQTGKITPTHSYATAHNEAEANPLQNEQNRESKMIYPNADLVDAAKRLNKTPGIEYWTIPSLKRIAHLLGAPVSGNKAQIHKNCQKAAAKILADPEICQAAKVEKVGKQIAVKRKFATRWIDQAPNRVANQQALLDKWAEAFTNDPLYALKWAENAYANAGQLFVAQHIVAAIEHIRDIKGEQDPVVIYDQIIKLAKEETITASTMIESSTSTPANLLRRAKLAAWGKIAQGDRFP